MRAALCFAGVFALVVARPALSAQTHSSLPPLPSNELSDSFGVSTPEAEGLGSVKLAELADWIREQKLPIFSLLISRDGKLVYELYSSSLDRNEAHYVMSATKSFTSALVGVAIDRGLIAGVDTPVSKALPKSLFPNDASIQRFESVTVKDVLGMSALDASEPPHSTAPEDVQRGKDFFASKNRVKFALTQKILPEPGKSYQYNDITPMLATGMIEYAAKKTELQFARETLFNPLGFHNEEWMHEDAAGIDNGAYGLRLRPIDMQKFGILFLRSGKWNGQQLISKAWVDLSFKPWNRSGPQFRQPNYGWFWWRENYGRDWDAHEAIGWRGQRITVIPAQQIVVTMTSDFEDDSENKVFGEIMRNYIVPASDQTKGSTPDPKTAARLADALAQLRATDLMPPKIEKRMVPSIQPKERHHDLVPSG